MTVVRIGLQIVIVLLGVLGLAALIYPSDRDWIGVAGFGGFVAFLLALTFALKEETATRLDAAHTRDWKPMSAVLALLGTFGVLYGASFLLGSELPDGNGRCRAICSIVLLTVESFGETAGRLVAFAIWFCAGVLLCVVGYKLKAANAT